MTTSLASQHFRNQINILPNSYREFRTIAEETWPGLRITEFRGRNGAPGDPLSLLVQSDDFVAEVAAMGHGLQMWLQTMWFLARSKSSDIVMLDEPDVYMHPDLQRRLVRFLRNRFSQTIITTHSVEILAEVEPKKILLVDKKRQRAGFADTVTVLQTAVDRLGATQNLQLSRLWAARKLLLVEGKDMHILQHFHSVLFPESLDSFAVVPNLPIGGWGGWNYAVGSAMLLENAVGEGITTYCLLDSDYHTADEREKRMLDAQRKHVALHIWKRKEIENYLLAPAAIARLIACSSNRAPGADEIEAKILELANGFKDGVQDCFAESILAQNRAKGARFANQGAREIVTAAWATPDGVLERVPGKALLSSLSGWSKEAYNVSFGVTAILGEMKLADLNIEVTDILSAIENGEPFQVAAPE